MQYAASPGRRRLLVDELRRSFADVPWTDRTLHAVGRGAYDLWVQCMVEELLLGRLSTDNVERFMRFDGREHLDEALSHGRGALLLYPHAGNVMLMIGLLSLSGYDYTQVALRGFPPPERQLSDDVRPSWFNRRAREARESAEDHLPASFLPLEGPPRDIFRALDRNGIVGIAFDGRGGTRFRPTPYLGRTALLATGPWRIAAKREVPIVPALCVRDRDRHHRLLLCAPVLPDMGLPLEERCLDLQDRVLAHQIEPLLRRHPDHYARWLVHCRVHAAMDDHPLFVDTAPDERWRAHEGTGF